MAFLKKADYLGMSAEPHEAFAELVEVARARLEASETDQNGNISYDRMVEFMHEIDTLASTCSVPNVTFNPDYRNLDDEFRRFTGRVDVAVTQINFRHATKIRRNSVALTAGARERIQGQLEKLKTEISQSALPEKRKKALRAKIAAFEVELAKPRTDLTFAIQVIVAIATVTSATTHTLANAPNALMTISRVIGALKVVEDDRDDLLAAPEPLPALPDLRTEIAATGPKTFGGNFDDDLDDDVPF